MPEFYMIFARKMPKFYMIIVQKNFSINFFSWGGDVLPARLLLLCSSWHRDLVLRPEWPSQLRSWSTVLTWK